jgi:hypothetical protein
VARRYWRTPILGAFAASCFTHVGIVLLAICIGREWVVVRNPPPEDIIRVTLLEPPTLGDSNRSNSLTMRAANIRPAATAKLSRKIVMKRVVKSHPRHAPKRPSPKATVVASLERRLNAVGRRLVQVASQRRTVEPTTTASLEGLGRPGGIPTAPGEASDATRSDGSSRERDRRRRGPRSYHR